MFFCGECQYISYIFLAGNHWQNGKDDNGNKATVDKRAIGVRMR
jgi:hypothetical protein